jgi:hypothetical protein
MTVLHRSNVLSYAIRMPAAQWASRQENTFFAPIQTFRTIPVQKISRRARGGCRFVNPAAGFDRVCCKKVPEGKIFFIFRWRQKFCLRQQKHHFFV